MKPDETREILSVDDIEMTPIDYATATKSFCPTRHREYRAKIEAERLDEKNRREYETSKYNKNT